MSNLINTIIFQAKNQKQRLLPWLLYHKYYGFDKFIYFDDHSNDGSVEACKEIAQKYDIDLSVTNTDGIGPLYDYTQTQNSNSYGGTSFVNRIVRSYNKGIELIKNTPINENSFIGFLDIDEFLVSNSDETIGFILKNEQHNHLYVQSFDIQNVSLDDFYPSSEKTKYRWCEESRKSTIFSSRGKSLIRLKNLTTPLQEKDNVVHILYDNGYKFYESEILRIHHFRIPCLDNNIKFIEDYTLINKSNEVKKYYGL
jgi:hypothetical protein